MLRMLTCLAVLLPCAALSSPRKSDAIEVSLDARASLFYDLECATGGLSCSRDDIGALLVQILGRELADRVAADWAATLGPYAVQVQLKKPPRPEWPDIGPDDSATLNLRARIQDVLFTGGSVERVREKLAVIMGTADARALEAVFNTAWPAYSRWWSGNEDAWKDYAGQLTAILQSDAAPTIRSAERMFGRASDERMAVHLIPVPIAGPVNRAFQKGKRSFVEFRPDDDSAARVAVVVHEYCHFLFMTAPQDLHELKMDAFARSAEPSAASAFSVMNEALASAIGNGLFMKSYLEPERFDAYASRAESFYAIPAVDRAAKVVLPLVEHYARAGRPLDREFFADYFRRTAAVFKDDPADPSVALGVSQVYYTSDALEKVAIETGGRYPFNSVYYNAWKPGEMTDTMGMRFGSLPVALFASPADYAGALELLVPGAALPAVDGVQATSCKARRESGGWVFLFVPTPGQTTLELTSKVPDCNVLSAR